MVDLFLTLRRARRRWPPRGTGAARFSATVRLGNTFSRSGTSTTPRSAISCGGRFSMRAPPKVIAPSVTRASSMPRKPEIARSVVVLPAPLVPSRATIWPSSHRQGHALHGGDGPLVDDLDLVDLQAAASLICAFPPAAGT